MRKQIDVLTKKDSCGAFFPPEGYVFDTYMDGQRIFIDKVRTEGIDAALDWLKREQGDLDFSCSKKLIFKFDSVEDSCLLEISDNGDFCDSVSYKCCANSCEVGNLKAGQRYYWRVNGKDIHSFTNAPNEWRFISIDGLKNIRDVGGRNVKAGLVYRGCEVFGENFRITEDGKKTLRDELKVKSILDLRGEWLGKFGEGVPIEGVALKQIPYRPYIEVFEEKHRQKIKEIMEFLSDENNYPVYFHCMGGADRTGMVAIYLQALCGDKPEDIFLDYELTSLAKIYNPEKLVSDNYYRNHKASYFQAFLAELEKCAPGESFNTQIRAFLLESGVSEECLNKVIKILKK